MLPLVVVLVSVLLHLIFLSLLLPWVPLLRMIAALFRANLPDSGWRPPGALSILSIQSFIILAIHSYPGLPALRGILFLQPSLRYLHWLPCLVVLVGPEGGGGLRILILVLLLIIVSVGTLIVKRGLGGGWRLLLFLSYRL
jgi:hypothetical protein